MPSFSHRIQTVKDYYPDAITEDPQLPLHVIESSDATVVFSQQAPSYYHLYQKNKAIGFGSRPTVGLSPVKPFEGAFLFACLGLALIVLMPVNPAMALREMSIGSY